jgi:hypothetical protein
VERRGLVKESLMRALVQTNDHNQKRARSLVLLGECTSSSPRPRQGACSLTSAPSVHIPLSTPGSRQDLAAAQLELAPSMEAESPLLASATRALQSRPSLYSSGGNLYGFVAECSSDCPSHASWSNYLGQRYTCLPGHHPLPSSIRFHDWVCPLKSLATPTGP